MYELGDRVFVDMGKRGMVPAMVVRSYQCGYIVQYEWHGVQYQCRVAFMYVHPAV